MTPNQPNSSNGAMGQEESSTRNGGGRGTDTLASGLTNEPSLKSNLRRKRELQEAHQLRYGSRKVTWPDAHGKDLAHVQEFRSRMQTWTHTGAGAFFHIHLFYCRIVQAIASSVVLHMLQIQQQNSPVSMVLRRVQPRNSPVSIIRDASVQTTHAW